MKRVLSEVTLLAAEPVALEPFSEAMRQQITVTFQGAEYYVTHMTWVDEPDSVVEAYETRRADRAGSVSAPTARTPMRDLNQACGVITFPHGRHPVQVDEERMTCPGYL